MKRFLTVFIVAAFCASCIVGDDDDDDDYTIDDIPSDDPQTWLLDHIEQHVGDVGEPQDLPRHCHCYGGQHWYKSGVLLD